MKSSIYIQCLKKKNSDRLLIFYYLTFALLAQDL